MKWLKSLFVRKPRPANYTIDGRVLCPYPNMTDDDLRDYEAAFDIPTSFPRSQS